MIKRIAAGCRGKSGPAEDAELPALHLGWRVVGVVGVLHGHAYDLARFFRSGRFSIEASRPEVK
jgi:hypothetical protein